MGCEREVEVEVEGGRGGIGTMARGLVRVLDEGVGQGGANRQAWRNQHAPVFHISVSCIIQHATGGVLLPWRVAF